MSLVLCVTQGGEGGILVQDEAIALAKSQGEPLVFLFVADISFLNKISEGVRRRLVEKEMVKMGRFISAMAVERALAGSVKAEAVVRSGRPDAVLSRVAREMKATTVVLESPTGETHVVEAADLEQLQSIPGRGKRA